MTTSTRYTLALSAVTISLILAIFMEASQPPLQLIAATPGLDKVAHFFAFGVLASLFYLLIGQFESRQLRLVLITLTTTALLGLADEFYQLLNPERAFDWYDLLADCLGAISGITVLRLCWNKGCA